MKRAWGPALLALAVLLGRPAPAAADITFFVGFSPTPETRSARGFALGVNLLLVGFEFDYSHTVADELAGSPSLRAGSFNALVMTPTRMQLYATVGGTFYRESLPGTSETNIGTNIGGGLKMPLFGPLRLRIDYRVYSLRGSPLTKTPQRFYAGLNLAF